MKIGAQRHVVLTSAALALEVETSGPTNHKSWLRRCVQEGWLSPTERASVSAISLRHILASPGYPPGTIAVNVTWMERRFNAAGQMHSSIYPSVFNRLRAIARY